MVEGSYALNKRGRAAKVAQCRQESERRGIRAEHTERNAIEFH
jgi:hypothetical protein